MPSYNQEILAVVGAGPKGIAVAVKAKVLAEFGLPVDQVILIEKNDVAANWSGDFGYTNGEMKLGTSPEKDVVFPLETDVGDANLNEKIRMRLLQFTWASFLIQTDRYSDWVDRGRPAPSHQLWALYLRWVSERLAPQVTIVKAEVTNVGLSDNGRQWELTLKGNQMKTLQADRLMLTGPGKTRTDFLQGSAGVLPQGVYDLESLWDSLKKKQFLKTGRIALVGAGENAASTLLALGQYAPGLQIDVISPKGFVSTRSEGYYENQVYSQPDRNRWKEKEISDRIDFIERTDLGVFSVHAMNILNSQIRHRIVAGRVVDMKHLDGEIHVQVRYGQTEEIRVYDQVILANGFDQLSFFKATLSAVALQTLEKAIGATLRTDTIVPLIQEDLSVKGVKPTLHLPMLAGLMQGPGFSNLSCLGRLSDRVMISSFKTKTDFSKGPDEELTVMEVC